MTTARFLILFASFTLPIIASDSLGWEHVSVSLRNRPPSWREMCCIKDLFWDGADMVIQYHPKKSEYVNRHEATLHLWRPVLEDHIQTPPKELVGE